ncbi:MAG: Rieske 2Fe-2S domain-containing protein [Bacillus subtilis]|nr:Rieske 2Fe-2S domain-containing protein [Bacillus subtilis]
MLQYAMEWSTLLEKKKTRVLLNNKPIVLAIADGIAYAIADKCPHMGFPISPGKYENGILACKEHALEIDVRTGLVHNAAKADFLKLSEYDRSVRTYRVVVEGGKVFLDL